MINSIKIHFLCHFNKLKKRIHSEMYSLFAGSGKQSVNSSSSVAKNQYKLDIVPNVLMDSSVRKEETVVFPVFVSFC